MSIQQPSAALIRKCVFLSGLFLLFLSFAKAQEEKGHLRSGNKLYGQGKYPEAADEFRKAQEIKPGNVTGAFNEGDALYRQGKYKEAEAKFDEVSKSLPDSDPLSAKAYHNLGNSMLQQKKYEECIQAYKNALLRNPKDEDTRYNLTYAQQMLKQQQQQQKKNQDKKDQNKDQGKKDQKKDQKKQDDKKDGKDKQKQDQSNKKDKSDKEKNGQEPQQLSKENARKMLKGANSNDKEIRKKLNAQKQQAQEIQLEKDW